VAPGDLIQEGTVLGVLRVLNTRFALVAPEGTAGLVSSVSSRGGVGYQSELLTYRSGLQTGLSGTSVSVGSSGTHKPSSGVEVKAPIDGIFYCRPTPDDPAFVSVGDTLVAGQTLGLVEVMKTFNPVKFEGGGLPESATLVKVSVRDHQEVAAGQILFVVEAC
jgi:biotin carboxyl carrier protein